MPIDRPVDFLGVDEIQLCADRERGHVFTDRLLHARGREETMLLGADTIRPVLEDLIPEAGVISRRRLSKLSYEEPSKIERLPKRSAVVGFSIAEVYEIATRLRQLRGGAAVVFGALSPRTRNAQVGLYQSGEVDYLVATDAIGMGLNLDIHHVALNRIDKFDGQGPRALAPADIAQIAGRAGRHVRDGTFGATSELGPLPRALVRAVERHQFDPIERVYWRNAELDFRSIASLHESLRARPGHPRLRPMQRADDQAALRELARDASDALDVALLWQVCQIPDFHGAPDASHVQLLSQIFDYLSGPEKRLPEDWVAAQVKLLDRTQGDVDTLLDRIARIRTWTYLSHRPEWLSDAVHWQERARHGGGSAFRRATRTAHEPVRRSPCRIPESAPRRGDPRGSGGGRHRDGARCAGRHAERVAFPSRSRRSTQPDLGGGTGACGLSGAPKRTPSSPPGMRRSR